LIEHNIYEYIRLGEYPLLEPKARKSEAFSARMKFIRF